MINLSRRVLFRGLLTTAAIAAIPASQAIAAVEVTDVVQYSPLFQVAPENYISYMLHLFDTKKPVGELPMMDFRIDKYVSSGKDNLKFDSALDAEKYMVANAYRMELEELNQFSIRTVMNNVAKRSRRGIGSKFLLSEDLYERYADLFDKLYFKHSENIHTRKYLPRNTGYAFYAASFHTANTQRALEAERTGLPSEHLLQFDRPATWFTNNTLALTDPEAPSKYGVYFKVLS